MSKNMMSEEAFDELIDGFEIVGKLTMYGRKNIKYHVQRLQQENKKQKEVIELIKQQPTEDDSWILERLNGFKYILNEVD